MAHRNRVKLIAICLILTTAFLFASGPQFFLGTSANGYMVPRDGGYELKPIEGKDGWYRITIDFTEDNRDPMYDGHYYKVTDGTWDAKGSWGTDNYAFQPAPVYVTPSGDVAGLGSVYIRDNGKCTIVFDSNTKTIYDDSVQAFPTPRIYGDFNTAMGRGSDWSMWDTEALTLTDLYGEGIYRGFYTLPAYEGDGDGYMMATILSTQFDTNWYFFGAKEQYKFDGTPAGMGQVSYLNPSEETTYEFVFDPETKKTRMIPVQDGEVRNLPSPTIYGDFNGWIVFGSQAFALQPTQNAHIYEGSITLPAYTGDGDGYMMILALSKRFYDDQWGKRWGVETQYKFDGTPAGFGQASYLKPAQETSYHFSYNATNHKTTVSKMD